MTVEQLLNKFPNLTVVCETNCFEYDYIQHYKYKKENRQKVHYNNHFQRFNGGQSKNRLSSIFRNMEITKIEWDDFSKGYSIYGNVTKEEIIAEMSWLNKNQEIISIHSCKKYKPLKDNRVLHQLVRVRNIEIKKCQEEIVRQEEKIKEISQILRKKG